MRTKHRRKLPDYMIRAQALAKIGFNSYRDYLNSPLWARIRESVLLRDDHRCRLCPTGVATQVHHFRYTVQVLRGKKGHERFLISVCGDCHKKVEFRQDGSKRTPQEVSRNVRDRQRARSQWVKN